MGIRYMMKQMINRSLFKLSCKSLSHIHTHKNDQKDKENLN